MGNEKKRPFLPVMSLSPRFHLFLNIFIVAIISLLFAALTFKRAGLLHPAIFEYGYRDGIWTSNLWFDGDIPKIKFMLSDRFFVGHNLTSEHPFMSFLLYFPFSLINTVLKLPIISTIRIFVTGVTIIFSVLTFLLLKKNGHKYIDSIIFTLLGLVSASATFWLLVPEAFSLGALSIIGALLLVESESFSRHPLVKGILINLVSISVTITNWTTGIFYTLINSKLSAAIKIFLGTVVSASLIWALEKLIFPSAKYFLTNSGRTGESFYTLSISRVIEVTRSFFMHTMVMPTQSILERAANSKTLSIQTSSFSYESVFGYIGLILWVILLVTGLIMTMASIRRDKVSLVVLLTLLSQLGLQLVFGRETFLYSMHFLPLFILTAANSLKTRFRIPMLIIAILAILFWVVNNQLALNNALAYVSDVGALADLINTPR